MKKTYVINKIKKESSKQWMRRHLNDPYVHRARQEKYRCRSAFKLLEIMDTVPILSSGARVLDLGCAPGGWCQVTQKKIGPKGVLVGVDLLPITPMDAMTFIQGDIRDDTVQSDIRHACPAFDTILSDMAPSLTGHTPTDRLQMEALIDMVWSVTQQMAAPKANLVVKIFHGDMAKSIAPFFHTTRYIKPKASRPESREIYLVATGMKPRRHP